MWHRTLTRLGIAVLAGSVTLAACGPDTTPPVPEPRVVSQPSGPLPPPDLPAGTAPPPGTHGPAWKAPFDDVPRAVGDTLVGLVHPTDEHSDLSVVGVDASGATRWAVRTNPACAGYGVTRADGHAVAVVLASDADNRDGKIATITTASAYDVHDGHRVWGPSRVSGPLQGPGLIFGVNTASVVGGPEGEKTMLSTATGTPVEPPHAGAVPLYEHEGIGLFGRDGALTAIDTRTGSIVWESATLELPRDWGFTEPVAELVEGTQASEGAVVALRWSEPGAGTGARTSLHDLRTGRLIAALGDEQEVRTAVDTDGGTVVVMGLDGFRTARAFDLTSGSLLWEETSPAGMLDITVAHHGIGYGTRGGRSVAIDLRGGRTVAEGEWPAPIAASDGAIVSALPPDAGGTTTERSAGAGPGYVAYRWD